MKTSLKHLHLGLLFLIILLTGLSMVEAKDKILHKFPANSLRGLHSGSPDEVLRFLSVSISDGAKRNSIPLEGKEAMLIAKSLDAFMRAGANGSSKPIKIKAGPVYFKGGSESGNETKYFLGVYLTPAVAPIAGNPHDPHQ